MSVLLIMATVLLAAGMIFPFWTDRKASRCSVETKALVADVQKKQKMNKKGLPIDGQCYFVPIFEYEVDGKIVRSATNVMSQDGEAFLFGDKVKIFYNPDYPKEFVLSRQNIKKAPGLSAICYLLCFACILLWVILN